jgi:hypothetical protein
VLNLPPSIGALFLLGEFDGFLKSYFANFEPAPPPSGARPFDFGARPYMLRSIGLYAFALFIAAPVENF